MSFYLWAADTDYIHTKYAMEGGPVLHFFYKNQDDLKAVWEQLPAYTLLDAGVSYVFLFGGKNLTFRANLKNVFNEAYIGQRDAFGYYLGVGRTYNASMRYNF